MKFPYKVKHDGVEYPAGTEVPVGGDAPKAEVKVEPVKVVEQPQPKEVEVDKPLPKAKPEPKKRNKK